MCVVRMLTLYFRLERDKIPAIIAWPTLVLSINLICMNKNKKDTNWTYQTFLIIYTEGCERNYLSRNSFLSS